jgi:two-component system sensor histidine kinase KdpD
MTTLDRGRPTPTRCSSVCRSEEDARARGKLKIFFGAAPGVGKTYAMLERARARRRRASTSWSGSSRRTGARDRRAARRASRCCRAKRRAPRHALEEFDLDAALARRPGCCWSTSWRTPTRPGRATRKRWQDVAGAARRRHRRPHHAERAARREPERRGRQITGVRVRETVPDSVLDRADEIELVDLPPDELLQRLREGKVYLPEQARARVAHFFARATCSRCASWRCAARPSGSTPHPRGPSAVAALAAGPARLRGGQPRAQVRERGGRGDLR